MPTIMGYLAGNQLPTVLKAPPAELREEHSLFQDEGLEDPSAKPRGGASVFSDLIPEPATYTAYGAFQNTLKDQTRSIMELAHYVASFICKVLGKAPNSLELFGNQMGVLKNALHGVELFRWIPQAGAACFESVTSDSSEAAAKAIQLLGRSFNAIANAADFAALFLPWKASVVLAFQKANIVVTGVWSSIGMARAFQSLLESETEDQKTFNLLKLAENASYAAFSVISGGSMMLGITLTTSTPIALMALGLALGLAGSFYEMRKDPYARNEGRMLNETRLVV